MCVAKNCDTKHATGSKFTGIAVEFAAENNEGAHE